MRQRGIPGVAVGVVRGGEIIKLAGYGMATLDHDVPVTARTVFSIASVDKQLTALAVMLLVEDHKVSLDQPISRYLAEVPPSWNGIHVRHLLTHTSGLGDAAQEVADAPLVYTRYTTSDLLGRILKMASTFCARHPMALQRRWLPAAPTPRRTCQRGRVSTVPHDPSSPATRDDRHEVSAASRGAQASRDALRT